MILRKVRLDNWRALAQFEMTLEPGVNVLQGPNEAGKSSVVEALDWALYRDITGARLNLDDIRAIIPATDPTARPSVQVELEFPDCTAVVTKSLAEDSGKRECKLTIRKPGVADEHFDRTEAQRRLRALFASDGLGPERGSLAESDLLISHQGETQDFLSDGSTAIRSTLGVATDGNLALTTRLERVRLGVEQSRRKEMMQDITGGALDSARASTEAARVREAWHEATRQVAHYEAMEREMESLRDEIQIVAAHLETVAAQEQEARLKVEQQNQLIVQQSEADKEVLQAEAAVRDAENRRDAAAAQTREIEHLRAEQNRAEKALEECSVALLQAQENLAAAQQAHDATQDACARAEAEAEEAGRYMDAWRCYANVFDTREARRNEERAVERLKLLSEVAREAEIQKQNAPLAPNWDELRRWRRSWDELQRLEAEAAQSLQIHIDVESAQAIRFLADDGTEEAFELRPDSATQLNAMVHGVLVIPGFGRIQLRSGARGAAETKADVEAARASLLEQIQPWGIELAELPTHLVEWESRREQLDELERAWQSAAEALRAEESRSGKLNEVEARVLTRQQDFEAARIACEPFAGLIELGGKTRQEVKTAQEAAEKNSRDATSRAVRARNEAATTLQRLRTAEAELTSISKQPEALQTAIQGRREQIARLERDGQSPEERMAALDQLSLILVQARQTREAVVSKRAELGNALSQWHLEETRRAHQKISDERITLDKKLVELRRDLFHHCEVDVVAELEKFRAEAEKLEAEAAAHEARLRGIAILDAALQLERSRLGRELAGPLNEKLSPWLSSLRGKETAIEFDENGSKIEAIRTREGEATISLPYAEHSEGMKEQTAFSLRLLLASRVARHLPSGRLPVILDDPFTQTDASRREGLGTVLSEAATTLQILFVTCHQDQFTADVPVHWVQLGDWRGSKRNRSKRPLKAQTITPSVPTESATLAGTLPLW